MGEAVPDRLRSKVKPFEFTPHELGLIHRRIHRTILMSFSDSYRRNRGDILNNVHWLWQLLKFVANGRQNDEIELDVIDSVNTAARTAYDNALGLGRSDAEARKAATLFAQLPLEKFVFKEILGPTED